MRNVTRLAGVQERDAQDPCRCGHICARAAVVLLRRCRGTARGAGRILPQDPRSRELAIPKLEDGEPCPRTKGKEISPDFAAGLGAGPAYPVGLGTKGDVPPRQVWMPAEDAPGERWRERPSYTRVRGSGCYGYQVDGPNFSLAIVFEARPISE